ncbi:hypothetical protein J7I94_08845 [Streptomyces sp. ISL-12]|uniref:hypothetical protein n=1 Tax=Streptomyces sp. ISL-12 TaxID=2819177 RepID=UPI001BE7B8EB|nr:hypothetical protein [Streptomyces sp. ISL-12]MBT2410666.1 hypothetical protein [Streptomyces sp. ISL-12]
MRKAAPGAARSKSRTLLKGWRSSRRPDGVCAGLRALIDRHAPHAAVMHAAVMHDVQHRLLARSKRGPVPRGRDRAGPGRGRGR